MPTVVCLAGPQGPPTTGLLHALAALLSQRGLKVGLVSRDQSPPSPPPAGALLEISLGQGGVRLAQANWQPPTLAELLARHAEGLDVLLSELHADQKVYKVEYCPPGAQPTLLGDPNLKAVISEQPAALALPCFAPSDLAGLAALLAGLLPRATKTRARMLVDGQRLPAKDFVQDIVASALRAMIGSLKGGQDAGRVEIHLY